MFYSIILWYFISLIWDFITNKKEVKITSVLLNYLIKFLKKSAITLNNFTKILSDLTSSFSSTTSWTLVVVVSSTLAFVVVVGFTVLVVLTVVVVVGTEVV